MLYTIQFRSEQVFCIVCNADDLFNAVSLLEDSGWGPFNKWVLSFDWQKTKPIRPFIFEDDEDYKTYLKLKAKYEPA